MKSLILYSRRLPLAAFLAMLTACGSGGNKSNPPVQAPSSSTSSSGSSKPIATTNKINVKIDGLAGALELINGSDALTINTNGNAQFNLGVELGVSYNVQVVKQPEDQICSVKNGRKVMVAGALPVEISCSKGFGVALDVVKPRDMSLKSLQVVSNYQRLGGANDPALTLDSKIKTSQNSFIALKSATEPKTYFISYVYDTEQARVKLDPDQTALALLIMDPIVTDAMAFHKLSVAGLYNLIAPLNALKVRQLDGDLKKLSDEIARQADKNVDLFSTQSAVAGLLEKALVAVVDKIILSAATAASSSSTSASSASSSGAVALVPSPASPTADLGVEFKVDDVSATKILLTVKNQRQRAVAISGLKDQRAPAILDAFGTTKIEQTVEAGKFYALNVAVSGPGKLGTLNGTTEEFKSAFIRSSLVDYYMPSLVYFSGGKDLSAELPMDCLSDDDLKDLNTAASGAWVSLQASLEQDSYYKSYHTMADKFRAYWAESAHMDTLLSCSSLGVAGLTVAEKLVAKNHLASLFSGFNKLREPNSVKEELFRTEKQSALVSAVFNSAAQGSWAFTNAFTLDIKAPAAIDDETEAEFSARCLDAAKKEITCTLSWTLEDSTLVGSSVKYLFKKPASQIVNLIATGTAGVQVSQAIAITVQRKSASLWVSKKESTLALDTSKPLDLDKVFINTKLPQSLLIKNTGNAPLVISAVSLEGKDATVFTTTLTETTVAVGAEKLFEIVFSPQSEKLFTGTLLIVTNDKSVGNYRLELSGLGTTPVAIGRFEVIESGKAPQEAEVVRSNEQPIVDDAYSQITLYGQLSSVFPHVNLKIPQFSGPGGYLLDDLDEETCLGFYSASADLTQQYCTSTGGTENQSGRLVVTEIAGDMYQIDYDFSAVNCLLATGGGSCTKKVIQLRGSTKVNKSVLQALIVKSN